MKRGRETESRERACLRLYTFVVCQRQWECLCSGRGGGGQQVYVGAWPRGTSRGEQVRKCPWHVLHCHTSWTCCDKTAEHPRPPHRPDPQVQPGADLVDLVVDCF